MPLHLAPDISKLSTPFHKAPQTPTLRISTRYLASGDPEASSGLIHQRNGAGSKRISKPNPPPPQFHLIPQYYATTTLSRAKASRIAVYFSQRTSSETCDSSASISRRETPSTNYLARKRNCWGFPSICQIRSGEMPGKLQIGQRYIA